jgi:hypothetical protein
MMDASVHETCIVIIGTAPLLLMVGVLLFQNAKRIDFTQISKSVPSFCCLFFIPFTYSILRGVGFGYISYIIIGMFTGDFWVDSVEFLTDYIMYFKRKPVEQLIDESGDPIGPPPSGGFGSDLFRNIKDVLDINNADYVDPHAVSITQEMEIAGTGGAEDRVKIEQDKARELAKQKMQDASDAFRFLMSDSSARPISRSRVESSFTEVSREVL